MNDYEHPALYADLVERRGAPKAWRLIKYRREARRQSKRLGARAVRRAVRAHLTTGASLRGLTRKRAGDGYEIA